MWHINDIKSTCATGEKRRRVDAGDPSRQSFLSLSLHVRNSPQQCSIVTGLLHWSQSDSQLIDCRIFHCHQSLHRPYLSIHAVHQIFLHTPLPFQCFHVHWHLFQFAVQYRYDALDYRQLLDRKLRNGCWVCNRLAGWCGCDCSGTSCYFCATCYSVVHQFSSLWL